jgi:hypothetical protein
MNKYFTKNSVWEQATISMLFILSICFLSTSASANTTEIFGFRILVETYNTAELELDYYYAGEYGKKEIYITAEIFSKDHQLLATERFNSHKPVMIGKKSHSLFQGQYHGNNERQESDYLEIKLYRIEEIRKNDGKTEFSPRSILTKQFPYQRSWFRTEPSARQNAPDWFESPACPQEVLTSNEQFPPDAYLSLDAIASLPEGVIVLGGSYRTGAGLIQSLLLVSQDTGISWAKIPIMISQAEIDRFQTTNKHHIWAIASIRGEGHVLEQYLLKSSDAGKHWECLELHVEGVYRGEGAMSST